MNAAELLRWGAVESRRRRRHARGLGRVPSWSVSLLLGGTCAGAALILEGQGTAVSTLSSWWLAGLVAVGAVNVFAATSRLYWRHDAALLARLPIPGAALYRAALSRCMVASSLATLPFLVAALSLSGRVDDMVVWRHAVIAMTAGVYAGALAPAAAFAAGALVASDRAQLVLDNLTGEFRPPKASWLGLLPGTAAAALVLGLFWSGPWLAGGLGEIPFAVIVASLLGATLLAVLLSLRVSGQSMLAAMREVSALDAQRLAHVDRVGPSAVEQLWFRVSLGESARRLAVKDASIARRRFPLAFFVPFVGIVSVWIAAVAGVDALVEWAAVVTAVLGAYGVVMARRGRQAPIEEPRLLKSLPITSQQVARAKGSAVWLRSTVLAVGVMIPVIIAGSPWPSAVAVSLVLLSTTVIARWMAW